MSNKEYISSFKKLQPIDNKLLLENRNYLILIGINIKKYERNISLWNEYLERFKNNFFVDYLDLAVKYNLSIPQIKRIIYRFKRIFNNKAI